VTFLTSRRNASLLVFIVTLSLLGWLWTVPTLLSPTTFAAIAVFLIGGFAIALTTWRNAQATGSIAQLLHTTEGLAGNVDIRKRLDRRDGSELP
jgi:hypothetical protein